MYQGCTVTKTSHLPIRYFLALLWAHPILHISTIRVNNFAKHNFWFLALNSKNKGLYASTAFSYRPRHNSGIYQVVRNFLFPVYITPFYALSAVVSHVSVCRSSINLWPPRFCFNAVKLDVLVIWHTQKRTKFREYNLGTCVHCTVVNWLCSVQLVISPLKVYLNCTM